jgi:proteasome lid subunit RPN8/RPN11
MPQPLYIGEIAWDTMKDHSENDFPNECCGFLYGHETDSERVITLAEPVANSKEGDQRRRFEISPQIYIRAEQFALSNNISLLGVYHSHPQHPAIPSEHDLRQAMPWFSYIIISVIDKKYDHIRSWQLDESNTRFIEENITSKH